MSIFQNKSKFALLAVNNVYTNLPDSAFQLSDGTWIMPSVPVPDLGMWKEWIGSLRIERLGPRNCRALVEEPSNNPEILDAVHGCFRVREQKLAIRGCSQGRHKEGVGQL